MFKTWVGKSYGIFLLDTFKTQQREMPCAFAFKVFIAI